MVARPDGRGLYIWQDSNDHVVDVVEADLVAELLTSPLPDHFSVAPGEPLTDIKGIGEQHVAELSLTGVATMGQMATLSEARIVEVASAIHASERQVRAWVKAARQKVGQTEE
jgi:predicted flap endonuclease-1-like 5' DNA nuclease